MSSKQTVSVDDLIHNQPVLLSFLFIVHAFSTSRFLYASILRQNQPLRPVLVSTSLQLAQGRVDMAASAGKPPQPKQIEKGLFFLVRKGF